MKPDKYTMTRRSFLKTSTQVTAMAGFSIASQVYGTSSNRIRVGNIYDHFDVEFEYKNCVRMTSMYRQIKGTDTKIEEEIVGTKGHGCIVGRKTQISGENAGIFRAHPEQHESHHQEHIDFIAALRRDKIPNDTRFLCESTLTVIIGRESAYISKHVSWDEIFSSNLQLLPSDNAAWDGSIRPVPKPNIPRS